MDIVQTEITLTKIPSCKSSGFGTWQLSGVLLWFAPAGDGVSDSAKCACPRTGFLVLRRHENRKQRSWRAHLSDTRYGDKEAPRGGGKKRRILTQLFVSPLNYGFIPLSQWERCRKHLMPALLFPQWPVAGSGAETRGLVDERKWKDEGWSRLELLLPVCV